MHGPGLAVTAGPSLSWLSDAPVSRGYAAEEFHTPQKRAGASEHRTESLLDLLDGSLVLIASWEPAGQSLAHSRRPREGRRRGELRRQGRVEKFIERDVEIVGERGMP